MELRYIIRNGEKVLQYSTTEVLEEWTSIPDQVIQYRGVKGYKHRWHDVPVEKDSELTSEDE